MRTSSIVIRAVIALGAFAVLVRGASAADPAPPAATAPTGTTTTRPLTPQEYERRIDELETAIKDLRKDTRQLQVAGEEQAKLKPLAGWDNGFFIQSADGANRLNVGGYVHFDGRYFTNHDDHTQNGAVDEFLVRRARLDLRGKFLKYYEFRFLPDFAGGNVLIQDAYLNVNYVPWARLQAGKYKAPVGLERLQSANAIMFIERGQPTNIVPNRDLGFMLWGQPFYGALEYELGMFNGPPDGASETNDIDFNSDKDFNGRVFALPFKDTPLEPLRGFGIGLAGTYGRHTAPSPSNTQLPSYKTDAQLTYFSYVTSNPASAVGTAVANGPAWRITPQGYWYWGPAGFLWEWAQSDTAVSLDNVTHTVTAQAWQTAFSYVVTGEKNSYTKIIPARNFDPWTFFGGAWGALELVARYTQLSVDKDVYQYQLADPTKAAREDKAWAIGANWYLNQMIRLMFDFDQSKFTRGAKKGDRPNEDVFMSRVQFVF
jgi:phosphate-selective porin OprO/OprP